MSWSLELELEAGAWSLKLELRARDRS